MAEIPDAAVIITAATAFMVYAGIPLGKIIYEHVFGSPERVTHPGSRTEENGEGTV